MQFAHFLVFLREAIAIPMAVKLIDPLGGLRPSPLPLREREGRGFGRFDPRKNRVIFRRGLVSDWFTIKFLTGFFCCSEWSSQKQPRCGEMESWQFANLLVTLSRCSIQ
jgi:hypothetical protein